MVIAAVILACILLWIGFKITGALLLAFLWLVIRLPIAIVMFALGVAFCCTILLIPVGLKLIGVGLRLLLPV